MIEDRFLTLFRNYCFQFTLKLIARQRPTLPAQVFCKFANVVSIYAPLVFIFHDIRLRILSNVYLSYVSNTISFRYVQSFKSFLFL